MAASDRFSVSLLLSFRSLGESKTSSLACIGDFFCGLFNASDANAKADTNSEDCNLVAWPVAVPGLVVSDVFCRFGVASTSVSQGDSTRTRFSFSVGS